MRRRWFFVFFLVSGFCSLVAEVVWLRLAMARFGAVTPLVSIVLSVFMAGLAVGSWQGGLLAQRAVASRRRSPIRLYAFAEVVIGVSAFVVPPLLDLGRDLLLRAGEGAAWGSLRYHLASGTWIAASLLPFCVCMGATFPLALAALEDGTERSGERPFGHLYTANVLGACCGTLFSAFVLIEIYGFIGTLRVAAALNFAVAIGALLLEAAGRSASRASVHLVDAAVHPLMNSQPDRAQPSRVPDTAVLIMLFTTGLTSMAMEVVWVRQFTPYVGTAVYAFASILTIYLAATFVGARVHRKGQVRTPGHLWIIAGVSALLPLMSADPRLIVPVDSSRFVPGDLLLGGFRVALGLIPFCAAIGCLTPMLVDRFSAGDAAQAGRAYAMNVVGCILGPLVACFVLLPLLGERGSIVALAIPIVAIAMLTASRRLVAAVAIVVSLVLVAFTRDYTTLFAKFQLQRDYEATVIATEDRGHKRLLINGVGITELTPLTKFMVHLPLSFLATPPARVLVVCFGMGTSFRSALSWDATTTAVELVPSVPSMFGFYHADGPSLLQSPRALVVIDDGRRFLERTNETYDLITIDPPPPVEAAGSGLLYSREFYTLARRRLRPGGILQQWFPGGERAIAVAVTRSILESFAHVRIFRSIEDSGFHYLASDTPIPARSSAELAERLPPRAAADLVEWFDGMTPTPLLQGMLTREMQASQILALAPSAPLLVDDRPMNEYFLLRRLSGGNARGR